MVYKPRRERRARGGKAAETEPLHPEHGHQYNAQGSPEERSESAESDGFRRGGMPKKKHRKEGGKVEGHAARHHLGRRARGGHVAHEPHHDHDGHGGMSVSIHHHRKHGGGVDGEEKREEKREERARGGHVGHHKGHRARGGGAPFSEAHNLGSPGNDKKTGPGENTETIP